MLGLRATSLLPVSIEDACAHATLVATVLGTLIAIGIVRHEFRGRGSANLALLLPTPEIVLGASP